MLKMTMRASMMMMMMNRCNHAERLADPRAINNEHFVFITPMKSFAAFEFNVYLCLKFLKRQNHLKPSLAKLTNEQTRPRGQALLVLRGG